MTMAKSPKVSARNLAQQFCCNWDAGKCTGALFQHVDGKLIMGINTDYKGKPCFALDCPFFRYTVVPGINKDKTRWLYGKTEEE